MPRTRQGEEKLPANIEKTPRELAKEIGAETPIKVSRAHLSKIKAKMAREAEAEELRKSLEAGS